MANSIKIQIEQTYSTCHNKDFKKIAKKLTLSSLSDETLAGKIIN